MKRFDLLKFFLFFLFSFMNLSILGIDDPRDLYFVSQYHVGFPRFAANDEIMEHFRNVKRKKSFFMTRKLTGMIFLF